MKHFKLFSITAICAILCVIIASSCGMFTFYTASYNVGLKEVESPIDAKKEFGETKISSFNDENNVTKFSYEDDFIHIIWFVSSTQFNFTLQNKTKHTMKIEWDDIAYIDIHGNAGRVMHSGIKYNERNNTQAATSIPRGAKLNDLLLPTDNVVFVSGEYGGWTERTLIPSSYNSEEDLNAKAPTYIGKQMTIMMPIIIENVKNDYTFVFSIDELLKNKK